MTKALALEWARYGIRVNALAPGYFVTELNDDFFDSENGKALIKRVPQRRLGQLSQLDGPLLLLIFRRGIVHDRCHGRRRAHGFGLMTQRNNDSGYVNVNGVNIAFRVQGEGPPLVLIMGYRLNSIAWPATFMRLKIAVVGTGGAPVSDPPKRGSSSSARRPLAIS
jgi:hypothetical protein